MKSRYDRNQELYEKVKNNDFEDYNSQVADFELDFDAKDIRKKFHEKKRLSVYFDDIEKELETANSKLDTIGENSGLEIKKNVDLKNLIEQAKKNHREKGGNIFSNTQYEILSSLNVEENEGEVDEDADLVLEDILGETRELNLADELVFDDNFAGTMVDLSVLDANNMEPKEEVVEDADLGFDEIEDSPFIDFKTDDFNFIEEAKEQEIPDFFEEVEPEILSEPEVKVEEAKEVFVPQKEEKKIEEVFEPRDKDKKVKDVFEPKEEQGIKDIFDEDDEAEETVTAVREKRQEPKKVKKNSSKNDRFLTVLLIFLIIAIIVVGFIIASQYIGGM